MGAEDLLRESLDIRNNRMPHDHVQVAVSKSALGGCLVQLGQFAEAESLLTEAHTVLQGELGEENRPTKAALRRLIELYDQWKKPERAALLVQPVRRLKGCREYEDHTHHTVGTSQGFVESKHLGRVPRSLRAAAL